MMKSILLSSFGCVFVWFAGFTISAVADDNIVALIDQFVDSNDIDLSGTGQKLRLYSGFALFDQRAVQLDEFPIHARLGTSSTVMRKIVESGFDAVPELLKHLGDNRKTKLPAIKSGGICWLAFDSEYDFNPATVDSEPTGVNLNTFLGSKGQPDQHEFTVADLCFVALGQILNRNWSACRYEHTAGHVISSPTYSKDLRKAILDEWGNLDREGHRNKLIADFRSPDHAYRLVGAYLRLQAYYPEEVERLVLELLNSPIVDSNQTDSFVEQLVQIQKPTKRLIKLNEIAKEHGQHYRGAIQRKLFRNMMNVKQQGRHNFKSDSIELTSQRVLQETFDWPKDDSYYACGFLESNFSDEEMVYIIRSLTHGDSVAVGDAVNSIMESARFSHHEDMVESCLTCLASRLQFGDYLAQRLQKIDFQTATKQDLPFGHLLAIAQSDSPAVRTQLQRIVELSSDPELVLIASNATKKTSWGTLMRRAKVSLNRVPPGIFP